MTHLNLVVIRASDLEHAEQFYNRLGLTFLKHRHGSGPEHLSCEVGGVVFEIYPRRNDADSTTAARIGLAVRDVDAVVEALRASGASVISEPDSSEWGRRAVVADPDGHRVELLQGASE